MRIACRRTQVSSSSRGASYPCSLSTNSVDSEHSGAVRAHIPEDTAVVNPCIAHRHCVFLRSDDAWEFPPSKFESFRVR